MNDDPTTRGIGAESPEVAAVNAKRYAELQAAEAAQAAPPAPPAPKTPKASKAAPDAAAGAN